MNDPQLLLAAALMLSLGAATFAAYEKGYHNGRRAGHDAEQCAEELRLVAESRGRHPSRCAECS